MFCSHLCKARVSEVICKEQYHGSFKFFIVMFIEFGLNVFLHGDVGNMEPHYAGNMDPGFHAIIFVTRQEV